MQTLITKLLTNKNIRNTKSLRTAAVSDEPNNPPWSEN